MARSRCCPLLGSLLLFITASAPAAEPFRYAAGKQGKGELKYVNGLPVLFVEGKPGEIGAQIAGLTTQQAGKLFGYPKDFLRSIGLEVTWPALITAGKGMLPSFPPDHLKEMESCAKAARLDRELFIAANTMFDIKRVIGCSTLIIEPGNSATKGPLFGRNLDFPTLGYLNDFSLITVYRPSGKRPFVSIGFPGCVGCLSGINDAGLALAVLEVYSANDNSPKFEAQGTPYALCFRRLLEECASVEEAEKLLRSLKRTTRLNLAICDPTGGAVFELTPKSVVVRKPTDGVCPCTNHFRSKELATSTRCWRYPILESAGKLQNVDIPDVARRLHQVNQGSLTLQTMIFEPAALKLHLAIGPTPTSALPMKTLELKPLLAQKGDK